MHAARQPGAHTQILVDSRMPGVLDSAYDDNDFQFLHSGAVLVGGLIVNYSVRSDIAGRVKLPVTRIRFSDPQSPTGALVGGPVLPQSALYGITVAARPTVPMIDVYAKAPTTAGALALVNAAFDGLHDYVNRPDATSTFGLRITQLGRGASVTTSSGTPALTAAELFIGVLFILSVAVLCLDHGWRRVRVARRTLEIVG